MRGLSQSVIANEDRLVAIYRRTGDTQFTHAQIADLIPCGTMLRYTVPGIFIPARDSKGAPLKGGSRARSNVWRWHPRAAELCRQAIERDRRWENLANGLTGGSECV
jgi:hypothetical protein